MSRSHKSDLTLRERRWVEEYIVDLNGTQAALRAGYSQRAAERQGNRLLHRPRVQVALKTALEERSARTEITADAVLRELALLGFSNMADYLKVGDKLEELTREQSAAIAEANVETYVEGQGENARPVRRVRIRLHDKRAALVDLGRHLGLFETNSVRLTMTATLEDPSMADVRQRNFDLLESVARRHREADERVWNDDPRDRRRIEVVTGGGPEPAHTGTSNGGDK